MVKKIKGIFILGLIFLLILTLRPINANDNKLLNSNEVFLTITPAGKRLYQIDFTNYSDLESEFLFKFTKELPKNWHMKVCIGDICLQKEYLTEKIKPGEKSNLTIRLFAPSDCEPEKEISARLMIGAIEDSKISEFLNIYIYPALKRTLILWIDKREALLNDKKLTVDPPPVIRNNRTLVPFRFIGESIGAEIGWDNAERRVDYKLGRQKISLWIGNKKVEISVGTEVKTFELDSEPIIINGRTLVPVRFISEQLGSAVGWNSKEKKVTIEFPKQDLIPDDGKNAFYFEISAQDLYNLIKEGKPVKIIDVRLQSEYEEGHIPGAINISYQNIKEELPKREDIKKDDFIVLYCRTGERAAIASEILTNMNYTNVHNLTGGISAWKYEIEK
jgi:rhodanese-related sulfurtransferase